MCFRSVMNNWFASLPFRAWGVFHKYLNATCRFGVLVWPTIDWILYMIVENIKNQCNTIMLNMWRSLLWWISASQCQTNGWMIEISTSVEESFSNLIFIVHDLENFQESNSTTSPMVRDIYKERFWYWFLI